MLGKDFPEDTKEWARAELSGEGPGLGATFDVEDLTEVRTVFGRFVVCVDCARTCLADPDLLATPEGRP